MTDRTGRLGAIVLAGGRSSRFGRDKMVEPLDGRRLLDHAVAAVVSVDPDIAIVVVTAPGARLEPPSGAQLAHDEQPFEGPLAGLAAGVARLATEVDRFLVVGGDMPTLSVPVLRLLLDRLSPQVESAILADGQFARPLPAAYRRDAAEPAIRSLYATGERRLRALRTVLATDVVPESDWRALDPGGASLRDIDRPDDM
jgi:molybdopterin-guanine dinucleotide biosynthesis protein A